MLLTLREALNVPCYAQDPAYSDVDKAVFKEFNIEVLEDPDALLEVDDSSIVYSKSPNIPVKEIVADIAQPAVLIWDCVGETTDHWSVPHSLFVNQHSLPSPNNLIAQIQIPIVCEH